MEWHGYQEDYSYAGTQAVDLKARLRVRARVRSIQHLPSLYIFGILNHGTGIEHLENEQVPGFVDKIFNFFLSCADSSL